MTTAATLTETTTCPTCGGCGVDEFFNVCEDCDTYAERGGRRPNVKPEPTVDEQAEMAAWLSTQTWSEFAQSLAAQFTRKGYLSERQMASARKMREKVEARQAERQARPEPQGDPVTEEGFYATPEGQVYKVKPSQAGRLYALLLVTPEDPQARGSWEYEAGAIRRLTASMKMDLEAAKAYGRATGRCCACGATLTNEGSIEAGIGPICASKF